ncbi:MAG TPA: DUF5752 family protein [Verrucomicrobiae bacterium]|nr:DUF5752 family protein [Verrucomicrobiae bacterium]
MKTTKIENPPIGKEEAQRILATVTYDHGFHFFSGIGKYTGETAVNLFSFYEELKTIEPESVTFHFQRRDFQNWIKNTLGDVKLSDKIELIKTDLKVEELKKELLKNVLDRLVELQTIINTSS